MQGGGGSPEQSQRVVFGRQLDENYSQTSARQAKPRFRLQARALAFNAKGGEPAPVRESETGRARNWTMPPLRLERECKEHSAEQNDLLSFCERRNSATIDNRCVEFDRRESTESTAIIGLRALGRRIAFTMAEILLSLTIIGVVAAITLPSLTGNINERTWNTQRKALYARFSQAIALMPALNGYGTLKEDTDSTGSTSIEDTAAETFVTAGLSKVLKINNICDSDHLSDCGIPDKITAIGGSIAFTEFPKTLVDYNDMFSDRGKYPTPNTKAAAFETANGESIVVFYNPRCSQSTTRWGSYDCVQSQMCANFIYDLNGLKGPNTVGKDMGFITVLYPSDPVVVAPMPIAKSAGWGVTHDKLNESCRAQDADTRVPNIEELKSLVFNDNLFPVGATWRWSSTKVDADHAYRLNGSAIEIVSVDTGSGGTYCIKR